MVNFADGKWPESTPRQVFACLHSDLQGRSSRGEIITTEQVVSLAKAAFLAYGEGAVMYLTIPDQEDADSLGMPGPGLWKLEAGSEGFRALKIG